MLFGVPRTKKAAAVIWCWTIRAVLRYIYRLLAVYVSLLASTRLAWCGGQG